MKTRTTMLSSLAIAALATVTLNSTEALAKGGPSGMGGMRSFSVVRTPIAVTKFKALNTTTTIKKLNTTTVRDHRQQNTVVRDHRLTNVVVRDHRTDKTTIALPTGTASGGVSVSPTPGGAVFNPPGGTTTPGGAIFNPPGGGTTAPGGAIFNPPGGKGGVVVYNPPGGGIIVDPGPGGKLPPIEPPPVKNPPIVVNPPASISVGVAAPVAVEPAGCTYERSVRKLPGGGLQRVLIKVCPDVIVQ